MNDKTPSRPRSRWLGSSFQHRPTPRYDQRADGSVLAKAASNPGWHRGARVRRVK